jgi:hypothetical protein
MRISEAEAYRHHVETAVFEKMKRDSFCNLIKITTYPPSRWGRVTFQRNFTVVEKCYRPACCFFEVRSMSTESFEYIPLIRGKCVYDISVRRNTATITHVLIPIMSPFLEGSTLVRVFDTKTPELIEYE